MKTYFGLQFGDGKIRVFDENPANQLANPILLHDSGLTSSGRLRITSSGQQLAFTLDHQGEKQIACLDHHQLTIAGGLDNPLFERGVGPVLALLTLPHVVCLHAATILVGGRAVLFLGESGTGKSSSAYALSKKPNFGFACDDVAVIDVAKSQLLLGPRRAWLREGNIEKTRIDFEDDVSVAPIAAIIRMQREDTFLWNRLPSHQAVIEVLLASFRLTHADEALKERINRDLVQLARATPVYHFGFPTSASGQPDHLDELHKRLLEIV
jgi:adenylate kinase family enzyme